MLSVPDLAVLHLLSAVTVAHVVVSVAAANGVIPTFLERVLADALEHLSLVRRTLDLRVPGPQRLTLREAAALLVLGVECRLVPAEVTRRGLDGLAAYAVSAQTLAIQSGLTGATVARSN